MLSHYAPIPLQRDLGRVNLHGFGRGLHSDWFYRRLENAADGLVEVRVMERDDKLGTFLRVSSLKGQQHDAGWHRVEVKPNGEALVE